tara:strand:- start:1259 stop:2248 length:990 start_codon:yes stop_codon:yes gene_type:complete
MTNKRLESHIKRLSAELEHRDHIEDLVIGTVSQSVKGLRAPAAPKMPRRDKRKIKQRETCVVHVSDTQIGKRTESYDFGIARDRMHLLAKKVGSLVTNRRTSAKVERCVILLGGDIVEGETIFSHQPWEVAGDLWEQSVKQAPMIISRFILAMSTLFREVHVVAVPGNHGRPAPKNSNASPRTNFDMIAVTIARLLVLKSVKDQRITWDMDHGTFYAITPIEGHNVMLVHGDQISGGGGIGGYPLTGLAKKMSGWSSAIDTPWSSLFLGHFHRPMTGVIQGKMFFANGTTESDNTFALEVIGESGDPCQRVVFFNKEHGPVSDSLVWLS